ncbi:hypothetical protein H2203_008810 [Taxawa tesnikishii (nom. ined.)]|nr:hypothetical protein H2203_008810 [Dothideales sp. JES 119]
MATSNIDLLAGLTMPGAFPASASGPSIVSRLDVSNNTYEACKSNYGNAGRSCTRTTAAVVHKLSPTPAGPTSNSPSINHLLCENARLRHEKALLHSEASISQGEKYWLRAARNAFKDAFNHAATECDELRSQRHEWLGKSESLAKELTASRAQQAKLLAEKEKLEKVLASMTAERDAFARETTELCLKLQSMVSGDQDDEVVIDEWGNGCESDDAWEYAHVYGSQASSD